MAKFRMDLMHYLRYSSLAASGTETGTGRRRNVILEIIGAGGDILRKNVGEELGESGFDR